MESTLYTAHTHISLFTNRRAAAATICIPHLTQPLSKHKHDAHVDSNSSALHIPPKGSRKYVHQIYMSYLKQWHCWWANAYGTHPHMLPSHTPKVSLIKPHLPAVRRTPTDGLAHQLRRAARTSCYCDGCTFTPKLRKGVRNNQRQCDRAALLNRAHVVRFGGGARGRGDDVPHSRVEFICTRTRLNHIGSEKHANFIIPHLKTRFCEIWHFIFDGFVISNTQFDLKIKPKITTNICNCNN